LLVSTSEYTQLNRSGFVGLKASIGNRTMVPHQ